MRPPLGTSDLKQNEVIRHHYNQQHHQLAQEYTKISSEDKLNTNHLTQQPPPPHLRHTILHDEHLKRAEINLTNSTSLVETPNDLFRSYLITPKANVHNKSVGVPKPTSVQVANLHKKRKSLDLAHTSSSLNSLSSDENIDENVAANFHIKYPTAAADHHTLNVNFPDNSINIINAPSVSEHEPLLLTANYSRHTESNNSLKAQIYQHPPLVTAASDQSTLKYLQKQQQRHSLQFINNNTSEGCDTRSFRTPSQDQFLLSAVNVPCTTTAAVTRKQHAYSWYAPVYSALEEEFDQSSRDSSPIHNLANTKNSALTQHHNRYTSESATTALDRETVALLESRNLINNRSHHATLKNPPNTLSLKVAAEESDALADTKQTQRSDNLPNSTEFKYDIESSHASSFGLTGGPLPRRRRFENFIKSLVGLRASARTPTTSSTPSASSETNEFTLIPQSKPGSPEITLTRSPSINMPDDYENGYESMRSGEQLAILQPELTTASTSSLNVVQQKLRHMLRREGSAASLRQEHSQSIVQYRGLRKCETVLALTRQPQTSYAPIMRNSRSNGVINARGVEQIRPLNRLRHSINNMNAMTCTRCSSLISLAAANSRYSLNVNSHAFRNSDIGGMLLTRLQNNNTSNNNNNNNSNCIKSLQAESTSRHSLSVGASSDSNAIKNNMKYIPVGKTRAANNKHDNTDSTVLISAGNQENDESSSKSNINISNTNSNNNNNDPLSVTKETNKAIISLLSSDDEPDGDKNTKYNSQIFEIFTCKLCLIDVESEAEATTLLQCNCQFCTECLRAYIDFEITEGAYEISCPDAQCPTQGRITLPEIAFLTTPNLMKKHHRYRLNREIELDKTRTWCPRAGCETVCIVRSISSAAGMSAVSPSTSYAGSAPTDEKITQGFVAVRCPSCNDEFCAACKKTWHPNISCEEHSRRLVADGQDDIGIPFDNDMIKCCPMCAVPIEKDEGCAQMMCKRCKHVFCWYCLASLDDDFLLRHYDKGPCKNKLGHSRASVVWHRAQVIGIFAGFGILLLVASPLLLLAAPCIICCKCRSCSGSKIDEVDPEHDDAAALQR